MSIHLQKNIPSAGGLGGGSSNAACCLKYLNKAWKINLSDDELIRLANPTLGTDTSFFIKGGTAHVTDNGLKVDPIVSPLDLHFVFISPNITVAKNKTENVYSHFDLNKKILVSNIDQMKQALIAGDQKTIAHLLYNAFEQSPPPYYATLPDEIYALKNAGCLNAIICGAGPTLFGFADSKDQAVRVLNLFAQKNMTGFIAQSKNATHKDEN